MRWFHFFVSVSGLVLNTGLHCQDISVLLPAHGVYRARGRVSVRCDAFRQLHHHGGTVVQVCVEVPAKLLGQVSLELLCSLAQCAVYAGSAGKLEKVL